METLNLHQILNADTWLNLDKGIFKLIFKRGGIIAGSFARFAFFGHIDGIKYPSDIDIFCLNLEHYEALKRFFNNYLKIKNESKFAITYHPDRSLGFYKPLQLIKPRKEGNIVTYGNVTEILDNFDFTVNRIAFSGPQTVTLDKNIEEDLLKKRLIIHNIHCPIGILIRIMKYTKKGFNISFVEFIKVMEAWEKIDGVHKRTLIEFLNIVRSEDGRVIESFESFESFAGEDSAKWSKKEALFEQILKLLYVD